MTETRQTNKHGACAWRYKHGATVYNALFMPLKCVINAFAGSLLKEKRKLIFMRNLYIFYVELFHDYVFICACFFPRKKERMRGGNDVLRSSYSWRTLGRTHSWHVAWHLAFSFLIILGRGPHRTRVPRQADAWSVLCPLLGKNVMHYRY